MLNEQQFIDANMRRLFDVSMEISSLGSYYIFRKNANGQEKPIKHVKADQISYVKELAACEFSLFDLQRVKEYLEHFPEEKNLLAKQFIGKPNTDFGYVENGKVDDDFHKTRNNLIKSIYKLLKISPY